MSTSPSLACSNQNTNNTNNNSDLFVSFVVDKLVHVSSRNNRMYFVDACFSRVKAYSELDGAMLESIRVENVRDQLVYMSSMLGDRVGNEQVVCVDAAKKTIRLYATTSDEKPPSPPSTTSTNDNVFNASHFLAPSSSSPLLVENKLAEHIKHISHFHVTQDGSFVFVDMLNDAIYFYSY